MWRWGILLLLFSHPVMFDSLQPHGLQHARPLCPSPSLGVCPCLPINKCLCVNVVFFSPLHFFSINGSTPTVFLETIWAAQKAKTYEVGQIEQGRKATPHTQGKGHLCTVVRTGDWQVEGTVFTATIGCNAHNSLGIVKGLQGYGLGGHRFPRFRCLGWSLSLSPLSTLCHLDRVTWFRLRISGWVILGETQHSQIQ